MGRQSSRLIYQGKDHKDIFFQGKYHNAMYLGNQLLWKKLQKIIPYISFDGYNKVMCINTLDVDSKTIKKVANLNGTEFNDDKLVRGDNAVGYMLGDTSWAFSKDGYNFSQTKPMGETSLQGQLSAYSGYALTKSCFLGVTEYVSSYDDGGYHILSRDIETFERNGNWIDLDDIVGHLYSGIVNPKFDIAIHRSLVEGTNHPLGWGYFVYDAKALKGLYRFSYSLINEYRNLLGADDKYIYTFFYDWNVTAQQRNQIERYDYIAGYSDYTLRIYSTIDRSFYMNIIGSFYENGKFIVYYMKRSTYQTSAEGKLQIYETTDFSSFTEVETPQSIVVKDISSDGEYTISFDSDVSGDVYIQPYCNLDNTFYFDESGVMHDDEGCLFHANINETGYKKIVTIYFDNHYFRESENNFCQILIFEEEDIEPPLIE